MAKRHSSKDRIKSLRTEAEDLNKKAAEITGQPQSKFTFSQKDTVPNKAQQKVEQEDRSKRIKFTTMLKPELREVLQNVANNHNLSLADVLELIIQDYFGLKKND